MRTFYHVNITYVQISYFVSAIYIVVMIMASELSVVSAAVQSLGYYVVKPEQEIALLSLHVQDVFVSLPTGYGKGLCYAALPALFDSLKNQSRKNIVIAVSPLIALMKDQVAALSSKGLAVGYVTQESSDEEKAKVQNGQYHLVLFGPEALLGVRRWREMLVSETILDEAHCQKMCYQIAAELGVHSSQYGNPNTSVCLSG